MSTWAMDLGTTNTGIARWVAAEERVKLEELDEICRHPGQEDPLEAPRLIPSTTHCLDELDLLGKIGTWRFFDRRVFWGKRALIGRPALEANAGKVHPAFAKTFKPYLAHEASRPLARVGTRTYSAREVAAIYIRELFAALKRKTGERVRDLVITTPVEAFEAYRAELVRITKRLGVSRLRFIDEPVAAAIGYGLTLRQRRVVLVVDFGGGTLDLALVALSAKDVQAGSCEVLAKEGRAIGGNLVDRWLLEDFCQRLDYPLREDSDDEQLTFWFRLMLQEACRVKEAVYFAEQAEFELVPPEHMRRFEARLMGDDLTLAVTREHVVEILERNGLYDAFGQCVEGLEKQAQARGLSLDEVEDVLMVGGSTLLPRVYPFFEQRFGRDRVRAWQPFEAVAYGAAAFAADSFTQSDFIVHDYAFVTYDAKTHEPQYTVIVPRGTRIPTGGEFWKRRLVPTCSLGEPETMFKLVVCEIGAEDAAAQRRFTWDAVGNVHKVGGQQSGEPAGPVIVPLNEANPTLGYLKPPHLPSDKKARLEISFGVNAERWLCATVIDLKTSKHLMKDESVVRLL
jgi:molecular chaperone DnaK (HSP70)